MLNPNLSAKSAQLAQRFQQREPFRHIVIEDFLSAEACSQLLMQFPPFARGDARNETGNAGGKSTVEKIRLLGPAYRALDDLIQSREFLDRLGQITGIADLLYDPYYFGGGTHENRGGQELDPHIDFNRHPVEGWHRRLNLIVYLNGEWSDAWGGALELHSDPRRADDRVISIAPTYNRAVIFETTEWSWHGFSRIILPEEKSSLSRKSIALYFYTRERPAEERADTHSTIYVDRPLPEQFRAGVVLNEHDVETLHALLARRDQHIQRLYQDQQILRVKLEETASILKAGFFGRLYRLAQALHARFFRR